MPDTSSATPRADQKDFRYLRIAAAAFFVLGGFHLLLSVFGYLLGLSFPEAAGRETGPPDAPPGNPLYPLLYGYLLFQLYAGWAVGLLTVWAGRLCQLARAPRFVTAVAVINWFFFPAGTVAGILLFGGLRRASVRACFAEAPED